jgi:hypothetical protein
MREGKCHLCARQTVLLHTVWGQLLGRSPHRSCSPAPVLVLEAMCHPAPFTSLSSAHRLETWQLRREREVVSHFGLCGVYFGHHMEE